MPRSASTLRAQLLQTQQQLQALLETLLGRTPLLPGTLYTLRRKCGKKHCRCTRGELHESTILSYRGAGRPQNISPPPEQLPTLRQHTADYRRFRQARARLVRLQRQLLTLVDALQAARVQPAEAEFHRWRSSSSAIPKPRSRK